MTEPRYLSSADAATYLGVTEHALRKWRERGELPFIKVGRRVSFDRFDLDTYMHDNRVEAWAS